MASQTQPAPSRSTSLKTNFGGAVTDGNRVAMTGYASWFQTQDATPTTALISPLTVLVGTVGVLVVPSNAVTLTIVTKTNNVLVSEIVGTTSLSQAVEVPVNIPFTIPVARLQTVYLLGVTGSAVVSFFFSTL